MPAPRRHPQSLSGPDDRATNRHTGRVIPADSLPADRLQEIVAAELAARRAEVVAVDPRLADAVDLLVEFVSAGGKRLRPDPEGRWTLPVYPVYGLR